MFKNLSTGTKLLILCIAFVISVAVPVYALVVERQIAIDTARKELVGSRYLAVVREVYAGIAAIGSTDEPIARPFASGDAMLKALADAESDAGAGLQTAQLAQALAAALRDLWASRAEGGEADALILNAFAKAQVLAGRIGDDSNLALDPDLDSYYVQRIIVQKLPTFISRLGRVQELFKTSLEKGSPSIVREVRLPIVVSLLRSTASEVRDDIDAAYRGNPDGSLKRAVDGEITAMISHMNSYLGVLAASRRGIDARDALAYDRYHVRTLQKAIEAWAVAQSEIDRLLQNRISSLLGRTWLGLALIGVFAGLCIFIAVLTHRHVVGPLRRLEAFASTVRETKDYSLRAEHSSQDEIGRVTVAFNDMLAELAGARRRETAERAEFARVERLTTMGEMAASIAHEVNQPLAAIVASGNAGLRWLGNATPDLGRVHGVLQRVVRDGLRASEIVGSVRAMFRKDVGERGPIDVNDLVAEVLALLNSELRYEQVSVQVRLGDGLPGVLADRVQLQQVFVNLLTNGIDAMRSVRDGPRLLRVGGQVVESDGVLITVADTGPGIDPEVRDRIFDPFFTTKPNGMGLGLSICRSIVEAHGGRVWVSPGNPHGTVFQLMLPCVPGGTDLPT